MILQSTSDPTGHQDLPQSGVFFLKVAADPYGAFSHVEYLGYDLVTLPHPSPHLKPPSNHSNNHQRTTQEARFPLFTLPSC